MGDERDDVCPFCDEVATAGEVHEMIIVCPKVRAGSLVGELERKLADAESRAEQAERDAALFANRSATMRGMSEHFKKQLAAAEARAEQAERELDDLRMAFEIACTSCENRGRKLAASEQKAEAWRALWVELGAIVEAAETCNAKLDAAWLLADVRNIYDRAAKEPV